MEDFPALLLSWVHRQNSYWEKSKGHDKVYPGKPHGTNGMLRKPNGKVILGQSVGSFKFVADQWSRKRPLQPADSSRSSCPQTLFKTGKTYNKNLFRMRPQWLESKITRQMVSKDSGVADRVQSLCIQSLWIQACLQEGEAGPPGAVT